jgi:hypothetical protein
LGVDEREPLDSTDLTESEQHAKRGPYLGFRKPLQNSHDFLSPAPVGFLAKW